MVYSVYKRHAVNCGVRLKINNIRLVRGFIFLFYYYFFINSKYLLITNLTREIALYLFINNKYLLITNIIYSISQYFLASSPTFGFAFPATLRWWWCEVVGAGTILWEPLLGAGRNAKIICFQQRNSTLRVVVSKLPKDNGEHRNNIRSK